MGIRKIEDEIDLREAGTGEKTWSYFSFNS
jgi:hypothetical protein